MSTHASLAPAEQPASSTSPTTGAPAALEAAFAGVRRVPAAVNEPVRSYAPGSAERAELKDRLAKMAAEKVDIPIIIGGKEIRTGHTQKSVMPHDHRHVLAEYHVAGPEHVEQAIAAATAARREWASWPWEDRAAVDPPRRRAARHDVALDAQRGDDAGPVEDGVPGGDRRGVRDDRFLAIQRRLRAGALRRAADQQPGRVERARVPAARGLRLRRHALQLHRDRRQSHRPPRH